MKNILLTFVLLHSSVELCLANSGESHSKWYVLRIEYPPPSLFSDDSGQQVKSVWMLGNLWKAGNPVVEYGEPSSEIVPPFDLLGKILDAYATDDVNAILDLYTNDSRKRVREIFSDDATVEVFLEQVSQIDRFTVLGYWICGVGKIVVYTTIDDDQSLMPYVATLEDGNWRLLAGEQKIFFADEFEFFAAQERLNELRVQRFPNLRVADEFTPTPFSSDQVRFFRVIQSMR